MSGNVMYMPAERVRPLQMPIGEAMLLIKRLGVGSTGALSGVDLTPVPEGLTGTRRGRPPTQIAR